MEKRCLQANIEVKIKPDLNHCKCCEEFAQSCNSVPECNKCEMKSGIWVDTVKSIFETKAVVVMRSGEVVTLPTSRLCGVDASDLLGRGD